MISVGLVLGGGGIAGYAFHVAALSAIARTTGWDPRTAEVMVGTSAGSGVAAILRGGVTIEDTLDRTLSVPTEPGSMARLRAISGRDVPLRFLPRSGPSAPVMALREALRFHRIRPSRVTVGLLPAGSIPTDALGDRLDELHGDTWPDSPLWIPAVDLRDGNRVVFGRDDTDLTIATAVEASCAIPTFFRPVRVNGNRFVDGGVHSPTNADLLLDSNVDVAIVSAPFSGRPREALRTLAGAVRVLYRGVLNQEVRRLEEAGVTVLVLEPSLDEMRAMGPNPMDPTRVAGIVLQSSASMQRHLEQHRGHPALGLLLSAAAEQPELAAVPYPA